MNPSWFGLFIQHLANWAPAEMASGVKVFYSSPRRRLFCIAGCWCWCPLWFVGGEIWAIYARILPTRRSSKKSGRTFRMYVCQKRENCPDSRFPRFFPGSARVASHACSIWFDDALLNIAKHCVRTCITGQGISAYVVLSRDRHAESKYAMIRNNSF